ncbi:stress response protein [Allokutzneria sp. NRRL B-24872]|uniref:stress response protein n=1 Tax=Allokutzneria sp. NRRL B-24872 TaxID=1137961 RepID=UPI000A3AD76A|nr:stress response protein [Allokutzneria sp. NRRL B-24872]
MAEESWHAARLIPTSGISGAEEQERRATSALLAVMSIVREFGRAVVQPFGAPAGRVETFIEVPFQLGEKKFIPDGLVRVTRGGRTWTALVEVKTGNNSLHAEQLEAYLDVAREQGFDALLTISNEIPAVPGQHPTTVDKRRLRKVALHHLSWSQLLCEAVMQKEHRGVADPEQAWILGELIRYLEHPRSGAMMFDDMGPSWVPAREALAAGTLRATDSAASEVALRFDALVRFACLQLGRQLGAEVTPSLSRKEIADPGTRTQAQAAQLASTGVLVGAVRIPDTVGVLHITADLRAGQVVCHLDVDAPKEGRPTTRVNWLVRQLKNAPETVRVESFLLHSRGQGAAELLRDVRLRPELMVVDAKRDLRSFRIAQSFAMGAKRGSGRGAFIDSVLSAINQFYEGVVQNLKPWSAQPPRIRPDESFAPPAEVPVALVSTAPSSQDGAEAAPPQFPTAGAL